MIDDETITRYQLPSAVFQAEGKLSVVLGVPIERAVLALEQWAQLQALSLVQAARMILTDTGLAQTLTEIDDEFVSISHDL